MTYLTTFDGPVTAVNTLNQTYLPGLRARLVDATTTDTIATLLSPGRRRINFMNAHCFNVMARDRQYAAAVKSANLLLPDGIGVALAAKMTGQALKENLNGTDFIPALLEQAAKNGKSVYLFGGTPGTADTAAQNLIHKIPGLQIAGTRDGYAEAQNEAEVIADINASGADIVLVALGVPMQELWLHRNAPYLDADLTMGVGAALDFFAGNVVRAPAWVRKAKSEWVWRLAMEPRRLAKRYLEGNFSFLARAAKQSMATWTPASVAKRLLDITVALCALVLLSPILLLTALAIKTESKGPALFTQTRVGKDGRPFTMIKFRSMVSDAEALRSSVLEQSDRDGICFKSKSDPRITRVGRFIRRTSIDELPQILNVLRGQMSIVGPRPALPCEVEVYPQRALGRLAVKPGITGVWQVSGRADVSFDQMVEMDLAYASSRSVLLDVILICMTFRAVISGRGAH
ncbi:Glycosyl transferase, WecB/TagA/CpsF family [Sulfitobacter noctilucicola]|uniref:Exopolysaccharide biosynthesis WecB/TagA/CpsF family protein n=1 Tax=Sulfitobacter noctilucicola TaxID=1342301 RepID=A0A7W6Q606_9RHOB|nr:WecB/TagA/CpsF family glycosyltransferase [Sulfitobacter noctilucicola]KIN64489.1 Glycosyl transferase, WecB/TagA/CpsF family [Sulfitobacter noctilucicola]MBB4174352.1 exopolysaccharide biosynthesis WecB/TagA/CpsF family protein [Sulfitobacter noctilucicola]